MNEPIRTSHFFNYISAWSGFIAWGGWAFYINYSPSTNSGLLSGLTQGTFSFIMTFVLVKLVTYLFNTIRHVKFKLIMPTIITVSLTSSFIINIHILVGTPNILFTVLPAITIAIAFCLLTTFKLNKNSQLHNLSQANIT